MTLKGWILDRLAQSAPKIEKPVKYAKYGNIASHKDKKVAVAVKTGCERRPYDRKRGSYEDVRHPTSSGRRANIDRPWHECARCHQDDERSHEDDQPSQSKQEAANALFPANEEGIFVMLPIQVNNRLQ